MRVGRKREKLENIQQDRSGEKDKRQDKQNRRTKEEISEDEKYVWGYWKCAVERA
jgi:hypothetical protein